MTTAPVPSHAAAAATAPGPAPSGRLALALQDVLTATARLGAGRQPVPDAAAFRTYMLQLLGRADQEIRAAGYAPDDVRLALFAVVALLDEVVLRSSQPALAGWARRPLQDELFGEHLAGEWFFQHVEQLLARADSAVLADLLEVHQLCLLLGFRGRYGAGDAGALHALAARIAERIVRLRGHSATAPSGAARGDLVTGWRPPDDAVTARDPWMRRLTIGLVATVVLAALLWGLGALSLRAVVGELHALAPPASTG